MSNHPEVDYQVVYGFDISGEDIWGLMEDVAAANDDAKANDMPLTTKTELELPIAEDDYERMAIGVRDVFDNLVGYASATIDKDQRHATVDCLAVHPRVANSGVGKWLVDQGLKQLDQEDDTQSIETVSFENFGQIGLLLPSLIEQHGFEYVGVEEEYVRRRPSIPADQKPTVQSTSPIDFKVKPVKEEDLREIGALEIAAFKTAVHDLVQSCAEFAISNRMLVSEYNRFSFKRRGRLFTAMENRQKDHKFWLFMEHEMAELVASTRGILMATARAYEVTLDAETGIYEASFDETQEIRDKNGSTRPFNNPESNYVFTVDRFSRILKDISQLSPTDILAEPAPSIEYDL